MDVRRLARGITVCSCVMLATAPLTARADATRDDSPAWRGVGPGPPIRPHGPITAMVTDDTRLILLMNWLDEFRHTVAGNP